MQIIQKTAFPQAQTKRHSEQRVLIAHHVVETCFSPNCSYHIILLANVEELLRKLDPLCFTHQQLDCLSTVSK